MRERQQPKKKKTFFFRAIDSVPRRRPTDLIYPVISAKLAGSCVAPPSPQALLVYFFFFFNHNRVSFCTCHIYPKFRRGVSGES